MRHRAAWAAWLCAGIIGETVALNRAQHATLSAITRRTFHTDHNAGRVLFAVGWTALWAWFATHVIRGTRAQ